MFRRTLIILTALACAACGTNGGAGETKSDPQAACRETVRMVLGELMSEPPTISDEDAQSAIDESCDSLPASERKAIVDAERDAAIARYMTDN